MTDIHLPHLDHEDEPVGPGAKPAPPERRPARPWARSLVKIVSEVLLISTGVFLGLMGEQWRAGREHREQAQEALRRFRVEITTNRAAIEAVRTYHVAMGQALQRHFAAAPADRKSLEVQIRGIQPVLFERTAWDLALATQSLSYVDSDLAFELSGVYRLQEQYVNQTRDVMLALYIQPPTVAPESFLGALKEYYGDIVLWEPRLVVKYDELMPKIERALQRK